MLSMRISSLRVCSACAPVPYAYAQNGLYIGTSNQRPLKNTKTDAYAEHMHQFLTRMLSKRASALRVCSACTSVPDAYAQHMNKGRSIRVRK
jgi:hypothetical protein